MAEQQIYHGLVELQQHLRLSISVAECFYFGEWHWSLGDCYVMSLAFAIAWFISTSPDCCLGEMSQEFFVIRCICICDLRFFSTAIKGTLYFWIYSTGTSTFNSSFSSTVFIFVFLFVVSFLLCVELVVLCVFVPTAVVSIY